MDMNLKKILTLLSLLVFTSNVVLADTSVIMGGSSSDHPSGATVQYHLPSEGGINWTTTEIFAVMPTAGVWKNLYVETSTVGATESKTTTLRTGSSGGSLSDTALTCSISNGTACNDTSDQPSVVAGDKVTFEVEGNAASANEQYRMGALFTSSTCGESVILGGSSDTTATSGTEYNVFQGGGTSEDSTWHATQANRQQVFPIGGTLKNFYSEISAALGTGDTATLTIQVNNSDTALSLTFTGSSQVTANDSDTVSINAGDTVNLEWTVTGGTPDAVRVGWGAVFVPATNGYSITMNMSDTAPSTSAQNFTHGSGAVAWTATSTNRRMILPSSSIILRDIRVKIATDPGGTDTYDFDLRVEGADTATDCQIAGGSTTCNSSDTTTVTAGNDFNVGSTPTSTPASTGIWQISFVTDMQESVCSTSQVIYLMGE